MTELRAVPPAMADELALAGEGARLLYAAGARQVWICGSLAHGQHWDAASDLDFVTTGISTTLRPRLTQLLIERCGRHVDVIALEDAPSYLRAQIMQAMMPVDRFGRTAEVTCGLLKPPTLPQTQRPLPRGLHRQRHDVVVEALARAGSRAVLDVGCGRGELLSAIVTGLDGRRAARIAAGDSDVAVVVTGIDPDPNAVLAAREHLAATLTRQQQQRVSVSRAGVAELEQNWSGQDALVAVEVLEHLDPPDLQQLGQLTFTRLRPAVALFTTPNAEFNAALPGRGFRHPDHRFEWDRDQLAGWAAHWSQVGDYEFTISGVGEPHPEHGSPSHLIRFVRRNGRGLGSHG
jgi:SAM-dependent methyltransferase